MGSKKKKGSCSRWLLPGEGEHKLHRSSEALQHADLPLQACVDTVICSQRDLYARWRENKMIVQLVEVKTGDQRGDIQS